MDHIIRRQLLELTLDSKQPHFDLQNRMSNHYYDTLLPILEVWFDHCAGNDEVLYIDRLVIDLGDFRDFNETELKLRLAARLRSIDLEEPIHSKTATGRLSINTTVAVHRLSSQQSAFEQWLWYMEKGYLPWNLLRTSKDWENKVLETLATDYASISRLRTALSSQPVTRTRITLQQDKVFLTQLIKILTAVLQTELPEQLQELHQLLTRVTKFSIPIEKLWQDVLLLAAVMGKEGTTRQLLYQLVSHYWETYPDSQSALGAWLVIQVRENVRVPENTSTGTPNPTTNPITDPAINPTVNSTATPPSLDQHPKATDQSPNTNQNPTSNHPGPIPTHQNSNPTPNPVAPHPTATTNPFHPPTTDLSTTLPETVTPTLLGPDATIILGSTLTPPLTGSAPTIPPALPIEGLFVPNAGILLTHPFLNTLFKTTNLIANGKFIDDQTRQKAIHLLHYLATGQTVAEEHQLIMPRLLCGAPIEQPIPQQVPWKEEELKQANDLLEGLISHWGVKNITTEGLRGNFLTRNGKLSPNSEKLHLTIEKHAVDILIRTYPLPWNMSIIKLPWLKQTIHMDW